MFSKWSISVYALALRPAHIRHDSKNYHWDKSPLYEGTGVSAFVRVAAGLLACLPFFPKNKSDDFGKRLGPCVGVAGDKVFKAFDNDKTKPRRSNIDIIKKCFDEKAILWKSQDNGLEIVEMAYEQCSWNTELKAGVFVLILEKLCKLHEDGSVHGDIRHVNLLSAGYIVDFDFVGLEFYPKGLNSLAKDGGRHPDVEDAISNNTIDSLKPEQAHDYFSMAKVLKLFQPQDESQDEWLQRATTLVENGQLKEAIEVLQVHEGDRIALNPELLPYTPGMIDRSSTNADSLAK